MPTDLRVRVALTCLTGMFFLAFMEKSGPIEALVAGLQDGI
jgi:hypothetical protein